MVGAGVGLAVAAIYMRRPHAAAAAAGGDRGRGRRDLPHGGVPRGRPGRHLGAFAGGLDRDSTVRILKDPRLGTFGVLAVAASLLLRVGAVAALAPAAALAALPAAPTPSARPPPSSTMTALPTHAGDSGLGATYVLALSRRRA